MQAVLAPYIMVLWVTVAFAAMFVVAMFQGTKAGAQAMLILLPVMLCAYSAIRLLH